MIKHQGSWMVEATETQLRTQWTRITKMPHLIFPANLSLSWAPRIFVDLLFDNEKISESLWCLSVLGDLRMYIHIPYILKDLFLLFLFFCVCVCGVSLKGWVGVSECGCIFVCVWSEFVLFCTFWLDVLCWVCIHVLSLFLYIGSLV